MNNTQRSYIELHIATFLFGFTAILGKLIQLPTLMLVWWRVLFTCISFILITNVLKRIKTVPKATLKRLILVGVIVAFHWLGFYGSIKLANASIALVCIATSSFFTSISEPLITKTPIKWFDVLLGFLVIPAMALIVNHTDLSFQTGIWVGLSSAILGSIFAPLNKQLVENTDPITVTFVELGTVAVLFTLIMPFYIKAFPDAQIIPQGIDWFYLIVLAIMCTTFAYWLAIKALKHVSAFTSMFIINMEPVYGITMAWLLLHEDKELSKEFYIGVCVILIVVFCYPFLKKRFEKYQSL